MAALPCLGRSARPARAFTLVELLTVLGIIALLVGLLVPALVRAQRSNQAITCNANLKQTHFFLMMYAADNKGVVYPAGWGCDPQLPREKRWPVYVFKPARWDPPTLICPADPKPGAEHSYVLNSHLARHDIRQHRTQGVAASRIILMGEKRSEVEDYYMDQQDFARVVEKYRHGFHLSSNYLYLDGHVDNAPPQAAKSNLDPWEPPLAETPQDMTGNR